MNATNITIRKTAISDANAVCKLSEQLGYVMTTEKTVKQIMEINNSENDVAYVAVDNAVVVGWIHTFYTARLECDSYCEIGGLVVDEQYRGMGVGKMLIDAAKPWCRDKCGLLKVRSNVTRNEAHKFYERAGFTAIKQQKVFEIRLQLPETK